MCLLIFRLYLYGIMVHLVSCGTIRVGNKAATENCIHAKRLKMKIRNENYKLLESNRFHLSRFMTKPTK